MKQVALITGWDNKEREISLLSANNLLSNIDTSKFEVSLFDFPKDKEKFVNNYKIFDIVIPFIHWVWWEDWAITAFCEFVWKPYLFSTSEVHRLCLNKYLSNLFVRDIWVKVPKTYLLRDINDLSLVDINCKIFVKPCNWWSSVDNWVFENVSDAKELISKILTYDEVLLQEYIKKDREFTVSIVWDYHENPEVLAISEVITEKEIFDYNAKYRADWAKEIIHADLDNNLELKIKELSLKLYKSFKLKTYSRIDLMYYNDEIYFLEVNTIPWFTSMSFVPQAIISSWKSIKEFLNEVLD